MAPVPGTQRFSWEAIETSGDPRYWKLGWELFKRQVTRIHEDAPAGSPNGERDGDAIVVADLEDRPVSAHSASYLGFSDARFAHARDIVAIGDASSPSVVRAGTVLHVVAQIHDQYNEGLGANFWVSNDGQPYASALEGRWGIDALLADALIVPLGTPLASDPAAQRRLLDDLRTITVAFRVEHGLPPEGAKEDPRAEPITERRVR